MLSRSSGVERRSVSARVSQCHGWGSMHSRVHNLATRSMQQRCIPHTFAIGFSRVVTDVGKHVVNVGVHSFLRIIFSLPFLFLSLPFHLSFSFPPNRLPDEPFARFVYIPCLSPTRATLPFPLFIPRRGPLSWILRSRTAVSHLRSREN